ncbi:choline transporter-like protein 2, partial [Sapajus apella]|uniref:Choline transporter-like protein n=1 Tax=Sapajus apella TaxID=9515 RepID=A0A6J3HFN0_SAPAP
WVGVALGRAQNKDSLFLLTQTVIIGSYLIAHGFFSVYGMCVDTLFLCFCEDLERNDGSQERPYFMSPELRDILLKGSAEEGKRAEDEE